MANFEQWAGFKGRKWTHSVDVRDFIQENYTPYEGDEAFLEGPTEATDKLWGRLQELQKEERAKGGVLDMETEVVSGLFRNIYSVKKDLLPMGLFQYGALMFPVINNNFYIKELVLYQIATVEHDMDTVIIGND